MKTLLGCTSVLFVLTAVAAFPTRAHACSPAPPGLTSSVPASGETYPGDAALLFYGYEISLDAVTVTIDGLPAKLAPAPDVASFNLSAKTARVMPPPQEGQKVVVTGDFCPAGAGCEPVIITFTAGPADDVVPYSPSAISFDLYDYPDFKSSGGDCQSDSDMAWFVDVATPSSEEGESPVALKVEAFKDKAFEVPAFSRSVLITPHLTTLAFRSTKDVLGGAEAPEALCFRASTLDLSGNVAASTASTCVPCYYRKDPEGTSISPPAEPAWTNADEYPKGSCFSLGGGPGVGGGPPNGGAGGGGAGGSTGSTTGTGGNGSNVAVSGCVCDLAGTSTSHGAVASLAFLTLAATMRVRRRRAKAETGRGDR